MVVWLAAGAVAVFAAIRLGGLARGFPLVPLVAFTPYVAAAAVALALAVLALRRWWAAAVAVVVAVALVGVVAPRALADDQPAAGGPTLRVLTINLSYGHADPERVVQLVRRHQVDVLSVQELTPRAVTALDAAGLARLLPHRVLEPHRGPSGSGVYAHYPLRQLPASLPSGSFAMPRARLAVPGAPAVEVMAVHPWPPAGPGLVGRWRANLRSLPRPGSTVRILAGDFNATLDHAALRALLDAGYVDAAAQAGAGLVPTWPAGAPVPPPVTIDHVLADRSCAIRDVEVFDVAGTDHRALLAAVTLPG